MMRKVAVALAAVLIASFGVWGATHAPRDAAKAAAAQGVTGDLKLTLYGSNERLVCGQSYTTDTWILGELTIHADVPGTTSFKVIMLYAEQGQTPHEFAKSQTNQYTLTQSNTSNVLRLDAYNQEPNEPYLWVFNLYFGQTLAQSCEVTVTSD